jgi:hypothetical protein
MALIGNYSVFNKATGRALGGVGESHTRSNWGRTSSLRGCSTHFGSRVALPNGYLPPYSYLLPIKPGGMGSNTLVAGSGQVSGNLAGGLNAVATLNGSGTISSALAQLVVSAIATLTGVGTINAAPLIGVVNAGATLTGSGDLTANLKAIAHAVTTLTGAGSLSVTPRATGSMGATIQAGGELLTSASIATAVWETLAAGFDDPTQMGGRLNFLYILANHKVVTNPSTGKMQVFDTDGTTVLYEADLWEDVAGSQAYRGQGADRRERLV